MPHLASNNCSGRTSTERFTSRFWVPSLRYPNMKRMEGLGTSLFKSELLIHRGKIFSETTISVQLACAMDFRHFPYDTQVNYCKYLSSVESLTLFCLLFLCPGLSFSHRGRLRRRGHHEARTKRYAEQGTGR